MVYRNFFSFIFQKVSKKIRTHCLDKATEIKAREINIVKQYPLKLLVKVSYLNVYIFINSI